MRERRPSAFYRARYYNQTLGRFFSRDPIFSLQSLYFYCNNSPTNFTDPFGQSLSGSAGQEDISKMRCNIFWPTWDPSQPCIATGDTIELNGKTFYWVKDNADGSSVWQAKDGSYAVVGSVTTTEAMPQPSGCDWATGSGMYGGYYDIMDLYYGLIWIAAAELAGILSLRFGLGGLGLIATSFIGGIGAGLIIRGATELSDGIPGGFTKEDAHENRRMLEFWDYDNARRGFDWWE